MGGAVKMVALAHTGCVHKCAHVCVEWSATRTHNDTVRPPPRAATEPASERASKLVG